MPISIKLFFFELIARISGHPYATTWDSKLPFIILAVFGLGVFVLFFSYFYCLYFWRGKETKRLFLISVGILFLIIFFKYLISYYTSGYIPDRILMYALPSPRLQGLVWLLLPLIIFTAFMRYRRIIETIPKQMFLFSLYIFFVLFTLSVAGIREGFLSIIDPFTRTHWEYTGNLPLISSLKTFFSQYILLQPSLALHSTTHPPGYTVVLYFLSFIFGKGFLGLAIGLVLVVGLVLWPLYYLFNYFLTERQVRRALQLFVFTPSVVLFTATSLDAFLMMIIWLGMALCYIGWKKNFWLAGLGGLCLAGALFSNFLFLLLGPFFLWLLWYLRKNTALNERPWFMIKLLFSFLMFLLFFIGVQLWSGYSILENFFVAKMNNDIAVPSNFESVGRYFIYMAISALDFIIFLGIPYLVLLGSRLPVFGRKASVIVKSGLFILPLFLLIGVFQGETGRLWLFLIPFFILFGSTIFDDDNTKQFSALLALQFFQIIIIQILFFTYW